MSSRIFIDRYQHYTENSIKCRRLAGTADEPARTTHIYRSVACARRQHMRTRYTTHARQRQARATTTRHWPAAPGAPRHAPLAIPRRPLGQPRAKRALPALRPATCAPRQLQRAEEGVVVSPPPRRRCPPQRRPHAHHHPWVGWSCPAQQDTGNPARHCQLRAGNQQISGASGTRSGTSLLRYQRRWVRAGATHQRSACRPRLAACRSSRRDPRPECRACS